MEESLILTFRPQHKHSLLPCPAQNRPPRILHIHSQCVLPSPSIDARLSSILFVAPRLHSGQRARIVLRLAFLPHHRRLQGLLRRQRRAEQHQKYGDIRCSVGAWALYLRSGVYLPNRDCLHFLTSVAGYRRPQRAEQATKHRHRQFYCGMCDSLIW